ncbi:MAG TPA: DUF1501 domain-containing protein [Candidatus Binataceae bacterium]|nr:DUF1501 domain-containing protein [Candidatus Binataceae bacterium]
MEPIDEKILGGESRCELCAKRAPDTMSRRAFLRRASILSAAGIVLISPHSWAGRAFASTGNHNRLVVVFLRGAVDGMNVIVPHGDPIYYESRPTIAVGRTGTPGGVLDLDGYFGMHPALVSVMPLWKERTLAFVHACGSPDPTRSHFDAQDFMESGTPGVKSTQDGWLNRTLAQLPGAHGPTEALSMGATMPRILSGKMPAANMPLGRGAARPMPLDRPFIEAAFDRLYTGNDPISVAYRDGRMARQKLLAELQQDMTVADAGAPSPQGFAQDTDRLAHLMRRDSTIRVAFLALGGWDTHVSQGAAEGQLAGHLRPLAEGLASFKDSLGPTYQDTTILVISEFGRTMHENGNAGTDHGHGNVMWVMGGQVRGGKVYGRWPGLQPGELYQERDLAITTDFRDPIAVVLTQHMGLAEAQIDRVFPARPHPSGNADGIVKA